MPHSIIVIKNTVAVTYGCAVELVAHRDAPSSWTTPSDAWNSDGYLAIVRPTKHWIAEDGPCVDILKRHGVHGDLCLASFASDGTVRLWGYRFHGKDNMVPLTGDIVFTERHACLTGHVVALSGKIHNRTRQEVIDLIVTAGGQWSPTITKRTSLLVIGEGHDSVLQAARVSRIRVMSAANFLKLIETGVGL